MGFNQRLVELIELPHSVNHAIVQVLLVFIVFTIFKHLLFHTLPVLYHEGNSWFTVSLKQRLIEVKSVITGTSQPRRMLNYVRSDKNCRSNPSILNKLDKYGQLVEWHPEPGEEKRVLLSRIINELSTECKIEKCFQSGTYCGYTSLLLSSLIPAESDLTVLEADPERRSVSVEMVNQMANNCRVNFVEKIESTSPYDLIFLTSDPEDKCFNVLRKLEELKLVRSGTVVIIDRVLTSQSTQLMIYVRTGKKTFSSKMIPVRESFSHVQDAVEYVQYL